MDAEEDEVITNIEQDPRHAGQIERYHTWPTHRRQSVGEHSWQVMRIMMTISMSMCTAKMMHYAVLHDVGEMAGDVPWPGKRNSTALKECMDVAEHNIRAGMTEWWGQPALPLLTEQERDFFKMCECIEMWEFGLQERSMGNRYGTVVAQRMLLAACEYSDRLPTAIAAAASRYITTRMEQESEISTEPLVRDNVLYNAREKTT